MAQDASQDGGGVKFLVDECLSPTYVTELAKRGFPDAVHPMHIGLFGKRDDLIVARALADDRIIITSNARDFRKLFERTPLHPGAIVVDHLSRDRSWKLVALALDFIELQPYPDDYMINRVVEVSAEADVRVYELPNRV